MTTLQIDLSNDLMAVLVQDKATLERMAFEALLVQLYALEAISSGAIARLLGMSRREALDRIGQYGLSTFDETIDIAKEVGILAAIAPDSGASVPRMPPVTPNEIGATMRNPLKRIGGSATVVQKHGGTTETRTEHGGAGITGMNPPCYVGMGETLEHGFHATKQRTRYTISEVARREVLDRLLALNNECPADEVAAGLHDKGKKAARQGAKPQKGKKGNGGDAEQGALL